jgi:hypothetical protein
LATVRDAVFEHRATPILDLLAAAEAGVAVRDWQGRLTKPESVPLVIATQVGSLFGQMLYLRRLVVRVGLDQEMTPERTGEARWYPYRFKNRVGPTLLEHLKNDAPSPVVRPGRKAPSPFTLGQLFTGASRWTDDELVNALADFGRAEVGLRGGLPIEDVSAWLVRAFGERSSHEP